MKQYKELLKHVLNNGVQKGDRTGTGTLSTFGYQMRINLADGFPLLTTKKIHIKSIIHELLWFLSGDTNIKYLVDNGVNIWNPDAYREYSKWFLKDSKYKLTTSEFKEKIKSDKNFSEVYGNLGPVYGSQWRTWKTPSGEHIDQILWLINEINTNPDSRRLLVNAWNPGELDKMALPPCHYSFQFYVVNNKLSCMFNMRSTDVFLGLPFNIASYALLTMMIAQVCDLELGELIYSGADVHIYNNHIEQVKVQLSREPLSLPKMYLNSNVKSIFDFKYEDFILDEYFSYPAIKGDISV